MQTLVRRLSYQLRNFRVGAYRLHKDDLIRVEIHTIRFMHLLASLDQRTLDLFRFWVGLTYDVEHVAQDRMSVVVWQRTVLP